MIANCSHDERGKYSGGIAGDQGGEWVIRDWYNRPWDVLLRYPDPLVGAFIAYNGRAAALNDFCGYDQGDRYTFWKELKAAGYDAAKISKPCEADCSSGTAAIDKAAGYALDIPKLQTMSIYSYTGDLKENARACGFDIRTASKYLVSPSFLLPGDELLYEGHHTCINLDIGANVPVIKSGYKDSKQGGDFCRVMQAGLNHLINAGLTLDGSCGPATTAALQQYQKSFDLEQDSHFGPRCWNKMFALLTKKLPVGKKTVYIPAISAGDYAYDEVKDGYKHITALDIWAK